MKFATVTLPDNVRSSGSVSGVPEDNGAAAGVFLDGGGSNPSSAAKSSTSTTSSEHGSSTKRKLISRLDEWMDERESESGRSMEWVGHWESESLARQMLSMAHMHWSAVSSMRDNSLTEAERQVFSLMRATAMQRLTTLMPADASGRVSRGAGGAQGSGEGPSTGRDDAARSSGAGVHGDAVCAPPPPQQ
jgi:hypothetical protein